MYNAIAVKRMEWVAEQEISLENKPQLAYQALG